MRWLVDKVLAVLFAAFALSIIIAAAINPPMPVWAAILLGFSIGVSVSLFTNKD